MPTNMKEYYIAEIHNGLIRDARRNGSVGLDGWYKVERKLLRESVRTLSDMAAKYQQGDTVQQ